MKLTRTFTVRTRMKGAIALVLLIVIGIGAAALIGLKESERLGTDFVQHEFAVASMLGDVREGVSHLRRHEKDVILNLQNAKMVNHHKALWDRANLVTDNGLLELEKRLSSSDQAAIGEVRFHLEEYRARFATVYKQIDEGFSGAAEGAAHLMSRADGSFLEAENALAGLSKQVNAHGARAVGAFRETSNRLAKYLGLALAAAIILVVPLTLLNMQSICTPLDHGVAFARDVARGELRHKIEVRGKDEISALVRELETMRRGLVGIVSQVSTSATDIGLISKEVSHGSSKMNYRVEQQTSALKHAAGSIDSLTATLKQSAENARKVSLVAGETLSVAIKGVAVVAQLVETMGTINECATRTVDIVSVIDGVAFQTNILALNAAVEAAHAGEQGRGFAVVAAEVRNLAQRSANAASEIRKLAGTSLENVRAGTLLADQAGASMNESVASVTHVADLMAGIALSGNEQAEGIEQINKAVALIEESALRNTSLIRHTTAAAQDMHEHAEDLSTAISIFKTCEDEEIFRENPALRTVRSSSWQLDS